MNLPTSIDNVHYYYNKSSTNSWIVPKCFTGDLIVTKGVMYFFPHTAGQYKPKGTEHFGLLPGLVTDAALSSKNSSRLRKNGLWLESDSSETLQTRLDAHINELKGSNARQDVEELLGQNTFKWYCMLLTEGGRNTIPYPERFTRHDIKTVDRSLGGEYTFDVSPNKHTFKVGLMRKNFLSDALWEAGLIQQPLT
jgi:hypothetical protein